MSAKHPVIAVTGSSGAGTTTTSLAFRKIFAQLNLRAAEVEGDSFHRYTRPEMDMAIRKARDQGKHISYFGPEANDFGLLENTFLEYGRSGTGQSRKYLHTYDEAVPWNQVPGTFTPWQPLPEPTDVLFYEGLHGGVSPRSTTWRTMSTCWWASCPSSTWSGSRSSSAIPASAGTLAKR
ncbi:Phosphoribulokinase, plasmid [Raoultella terrigena]|uniref:phosphoribulokinase n=1 Tax=Raoultella terrigena TaxID=577 RepID=A0A4U9D3C9_RAOTE|nr:Phosphoribulokinase, plasmid [Raoultella terrigena]